MYDYVPGKAAWLALGLPGEGTLADTARAGAVARTDVPTCGRQETVGAVRERMGDWPVAVVVEGRCVLGLVRAEALALEPSTPVESVMQAGPSTFRPSVSCEELASYLDDKGQPRALLTTLQGELVGIVTMEDLDACRTGAQAGRDGDG